MVVLARTALVAVLLAACGPTGQPIADQTVDVGCGMCRFKIEGGPMGCYWAADFGDGRVVPVGGSVLPQDHENHAPDGMCNVTREAVVSGTLYADRFQATKFDLQPVAPAGDPEFGVKDAH